MKMFNASLEKYKVQCNSIVFRFEPRSFTVVPDELWPFLYTQLKDCGVFAVKPSMAKEQVKEEHRTALLAYLSGRLAERIVNYTSQEDEFRKKGITFKRHARFDEALRWEQEIRQILEMERPIEVELSFLNEERRKQLGFDKASIQMVEGDDLFEDFDNVEIAKASGAGFQSESSDDDAPKKRGRPKTFKGLEAPELG